VANLLEAGEVPKIREFAALARLHRLDGAIVGVQENALAVGLVLEGKAAAVWVRRV